MLNANSFVSDKIYDAYELNEKEGISHAEAKMDRLKPNKKYPIK